MEVTASQRQTSTEQLTKFRAQIPNGIALVANRINTNFTKGIALTDPSILERLELDAPTLEGALQEQELLFETLQAAGANILISEINENLGDSCYRQDSSLSLIHI